MYKAESTGKFQFTGGRLDDSKSPKQNALLKPLQDLGLKVRLVQDIEPFVVIDEIERDSEKELLVLIHYLAEVSEILSPEKSKWFTMPEITELEKNNLVSSPNVRLACQFFSKYNK